MITAMSWTSGTRNKKFPVGSDNPKCLWSDEHINAPGLSDAVNAGSDYEW